MPASCERSLKSKLRFTNIVKLYEHSIPLIFSMFILQGMTGDPVKIHLHTNFIFSFLLVALYPGGGGHLYIFLYGDVPLNRVSFSGFRLRDRVSFL